MNILYRIAVFILVAGTFAAHAADPPAPGKPIRVLFVGNSLTHTNGLPRVFQSIAATAGFEVEVAGETLRNANLRNHFEGGALDRIRGERWDYVVLQEAFFVSDTERLTKYSRLFDTEIRKAGAKTVLFLHWAAPRSPDKQAAMDQLFGSLGRELGAVVAPVGPAWRNALGKNLYVYDLYNQDGMHPAHLGTYVAACVFFSTLFDQADPEADAEEKRSASRLAAWEAVRAFSDK